MFSILTDFHLKESRTVETKESRKQFRLAAHFFARLESWITIGLSSLDYAHATTALSTLVNMDVTCICIYTVDFSGEINPAPVVTVKAHHSQ